MHASRSLRGILLALLAAFLFACMDTSIKYLTAQYDAPLIVAIRYMVLCLLMVTLLAPSQGHRLVQVKRTGLVLVRAVCLAAASLFLALALKRMPVAESTALLFLAPLLVVLMSGRVLREDVGVIGWTAAVAGFAGVLMIARPGAGLDPAGIVFGLCAAMLTAAYQLLSRVLAHSERTIALLFYTALIGAVGFGAALPWFWPESVPSAFQSALFVAVGVLGGLGHFLFTAAHRDAPASLLAPVMYAQLLWAALMGWLAYGHVPDRVSMLGMCLVAAAGIAIALKSRRVARAIAQPADV
jgi:drug/metabolite transporter (DMT)-like permease